jgi:hypothetical protein
LSTLVTLLHVAVIFDTVLFYYQFICNVACRERSMKRVSVWTPDGRRLIGTPRQRLEDFIEMDVKIVGFCGMYWILVVQDRD